MHSKHLHFVTEREGGVWSGYPVQRLTDNKTQFSFKPYVKEKAKEKERCLLLLAQLQEVPAVFSISKSTDLESSNIHQILVLHTLFLSMHRYPNNPL